MKDFYYKFQISGKRKKTITQWAVYSLVTALSASLLSLVLSSDAGKFLTELSCAIAYEIDNEDFSRLLATLCKSGEDGEVTEEEARAIIDRGSRIVGPDVARDFLDEDLENLERRAEEEVDFAVKRYEALNPQADPKIDESLKRAHPDFSHEQLCVLSQAERGEEDSDGSEAQRLLGGPISIRYVGMGVCEEE
jgi:hypothetical protein